MLALRAQAVAGAATQMSYGRSFLQRPAIFWVGALVLSARVGPAANHLRAGVGDLEASSDGVVVGCGAGVDVEFGAAAAANSGEFEAGGGECGLDAAATELGEDGGAREVGDADP